jgi:peptidoglycan/xylan/chitin deacetylase (PgdA/CDA1 family)
MYHRVLPAVPPHDPYDICISVGTFEAQMAWLVRSGFTVLPLSALERLFDRPHQAALPKRAAVVTFDDGYEDNYLYAWPVLRRFGLEATVFLVSDAIARDNAFDDSFGSPRAKMMQPSQIREMRAGGVEFGSHSRSHPPSLCDLSDRSLEDELRVSRAAIEELVDAPVVHFSYPHSRTDERVERAVAAAGYRLACAGEGSSFSRFRVHRIEPRAASPMWLGLRMLARRWKRRLRRTQAL